MKISIVLQVQFGVHLLLSWSCWSWSHISWELILKQTLTFGGESCTPRGVTPPLETNDWEVIHPFDAILCLPIQYASHDLSKGLVWMLMSSITYIRLRCKRQSSRKNPFIGKNCVFAPWVTHRIELWKLPKSMPNMWGKELRLLQIIGCESYIASGYYSTSKFDLKYLKFS